MQRTATNGPRRPDVRQVNSRRTSTRRGAPYPRIASRSSSLGHPGGFVSLFIEAAPEDDQPLVQTRLHRAQRTSLPIGALLKAHAVVLLQYDRGSLFFGQLLHRSRHDPAERPSGDQLFDRLRRPLICSNLGQVLTLGDLRNGRPPLTANPITAQVQRDPVDPGRELRLTPEVPDPPVRPQERLLDDVACFLFASDDAVREGID